MKRWMNNFFKTANRDQSRRGPTGNRWDPIHQNNRPRNSVNNWFKGKSAGTPIVLGLKTLVSCRCSLKTHSFAIHVWKGLLGSSCTRCPGARVDFIRARAMRTEDHEE